MCDKVDTIKGSKGKVLVTEWENDGVRAREGVQPFLSRDNDLLRGNPLISCL